MKKYILVLLILLLIKSTSHSQSISLEANQQIAFPGISNNLILTVENSSCSDLIIKTDNGSLEHETENVKNCRYVYFPQKVGLGNIYIFIKQNDDTIKVGQKLISIKPWPQQDAEFARIKNGEISRGIFLSHNEVIARISGFDMSGKHHIVSYQINLFRGDTKILTLDNKGGVIEKKHQQKLRKLRKGDIVTFDNIMAFLPGEKTTRKLNKITLRIKK